MTPLDLLPAEAEDPDATAPRPAVDRRPCVYCGRRVCEHPRRFVGPDNCWHECRIGIADDRGDESAKRAAARALHPSVFPTNLRILGITALLALRLGIDWGEAAAYSGGVEAVYVHEDESTTTGPGDAGGTGGAPLHRAPRIARVLLGLRARPGLDGGRGRPLAARTADSRGGGSSRSAAVLGRLGRCATSRGAHAAAGLWRRLVGHLGTGQLRVRP